MNSETIKLQFLKCTFFFFIYSKLTNIITYSQLFRVLIRMKINSLIHVVVYIMYNNIEKRHYFIRKLNKYKLLKLVGRIYV